MATPKTLISETFYHKTSCLRFELGSYKDSTKFKIEIAPQLQQNGQPVEKRFDYEQKLSMVFGLGEILRIKRFTENLLNPQKQVPADGYAIEHFFEVDGAKKKSCLFMKRVDNLLKSKADLWAKDPYQFAYSVAVTLYSSMKERSTTFILSSEEAYWIINEMPFFAWAYKQENARIIEENRAIKQSGGSVPDQSASRSNYRAPAAGADFAGEGSSAPGTPPAFPSDSAFDDIPF